MIRVDPAELCSPRPGDRGVRDPTNRPQRAGGGAASMSRKLSRRQFIGATAGAAAAASLGGTAAISLGKGRPTIPPGLLGVQQFSVRDATARLSIASSN